MNETCLVVEDLSVEINFAKTSGRAVQDVSFKLNRGETLAIVGESGCGKTMLALSLMRLLPNVAKIVSGRVYVGEKEICGLDEGAMRRIRGQKIAYISQEPHTALNPVMTVEAQIGEVLNRRGLASRYIREEVVRQLERVGMSDASVRARAYPHQLSGGMRQRVAIAMALAGEPDVLIADEPTTALDVTIQAQILALFAQLQTQLGMGLVLITHDLGVVKQLAHHVAVMYCGEFVEAATAKQLFLQPSHPYTQALLAAVPNAGQRGSPLSSIPGIVSSIGQHASGCRFHPRCRYAWDECQTSTPVAVDVAMGHQVRCNLYQQVPVVKPRVDGQGQGRVDLMPESESPPEKILQVEGLRVSFEVPKRLFQASDPRLVAIEDIDLSLYDGQIAAVVGESGCGKSTLLKAIMGLQTYDKGDIRYEGQPILQHPTFRKDVQMIFQDSYAALNPRMRVSRIVVEGLLAQGLVSRSTAKARVRELLEQVGLAPELATRFPGQLSGGQRQRVCIARALAVEPQVLVCDEPTSALDVSVQAQILNLLMELRQRLNLTLLVITHDLSVVAYIADEVMVMYLGRIVEQGRAEEVLNTPRHPYTQVLLASAPSLSENRDEGVSVAVGEPPSQMKKPSGCAFRDRCPAAMPQCSQIQPNYSVFSETHKVACFLYEQPQLHVASVRIG